jgi:hypothetical protein
MNAVLTSLSLLTASLVGCATQADDAGPARPTDVVVNSMPLSQDNLQRLEQLLRVRLRPGRYWYDARSGLAGVEGQGASALLPAGLPLDGPLQANASRGSTRIFLNGRELVTAELNYLETLIGARVPAGRYWLDHLGNAGPEGGPAQVNLLRLAQTRNVASRNAWGWRSNNTDIGAVGQGGFVGIIGRDFSVIVDR